MHMKKLPFSTVAAAVLAVWFSFTTTFAQDTLAFPEDDGPKKVSGGLGYALGNFGMKDVDALNSFIGQGIALRGNNFAMGGGGAVMVRSVMLGGEGASYFKQKASLSDQDLTYEAGWGRFYMGYVLLGKKGILLYPKVGIGGYKESITLHHHTAPASMDSVFLGTYTGTTVVKKGVLMSFGLGFDWMPGFDEAAGSGIVLGVDAGYHLALSEKGWQAYKSTLSGGPSIVPTGFYASLRIGFGGWNRQ